MTILARNSAAMPFASRLATIAIPASLAGFGGAVPAPAAEDPWKDYKPIDLVCPGQAETKLALTSQHNLNGDRDRATLALANGEIVFVVLEAAASGASYEEVFSAPPWDTDEIAARNARRIIHVLEPYLAACADGGPALQQVRQTLERNRQALGLE